MRHVRRRLIVLSLAWLIALGGSASAWAGRGNGGGKAAPTGSFSLVLLDPADGVANWGDQLTFDVSSTAPNPTVRVSCAQGGVEVYHASAGFYPDYPWSDVFTLRSQAWTGGEADCTATLYSVAPNGKATTMGTLGFHALA